MKKKYIIAAVLIVLVSVIALIGTTYAFLTMTIEGDKTITLRAGVFKVDFTEGDSINLNNAAPVSDSKGQSQTPYTFTITNEGNLTAYYHVLMEEDSANTLANSYLKMRITGSNGYDSGVVKVSSYGTGTFEIISENELAVDGTVTYNLWMWLDENADNSAQGKNYKSKIVVESFDRSQMKTVADVLLAGVGENGAINTTDPDQTFITGEDPNNYIWYSGKLWRAVSIDTSDNSVKLVTQWNISAIPYSSGDSAFEGSYMEEWLNDTSVDGFLGNLREPEKFIKMDSEWNATKTTATTKPAETTMVTDPVGLLNIYEYTMSYSGTTASNGYLNNGLIWWSITPYSSSRVRYVRSNGNVSNVDSPSTADGVRPSINLKSSVRIVDGDGSADNPYRLNGDNEKDLSGTMLNTRYSGEYIRFGIGENNLYRIVSHENGTGTKITSAEPLKSGETFVESAFDSNRNVNYSSSNTIGTFLNNDYLNTGNGYLTDEDIAMIEDATTWYLGTVGSGASYKLAKYTNETDNILTSSVTTAKVGLLRMGELMAGQFDRYGNNTNYWTLTPYSSSYVHLVDNYGSARSYSLSSARGVRPSINLKSNVQIVNGDGTLNSPFELQLVS